jgi:hypothetical protein
MKCFKAISCMNGFGRRLKTMPQQLRFLLAARCVVVLLLVHLLLLHVTRVVFCCCLFRSRYNVCRSAACCRLFNVSSLLLTRLAIGYRTDCTCYIITCIAASAVVMRYMSCIGQGGPWSRGVCLLRHTVTLRVT